jgi:hypothetical protein
MSGVLRFFRSAPFAGSVVTAITAFAATGGFLFLATLYLQDVLGMSALYAGLHMLPMAVVMALGAVLSSRILARRGARLPVLVAGVGLAAGSVLSSGLTVSSGTAPIIIAFAIFGIGAGMVNAPITYAAVSGMPVSQAGVASGIASTSRQVGASLSVAVTGSILAASLLGPVPDPVCVGQSRRLAAAGRLRLRRPGARPGHHQPVGAQDRRPHRLRLRGGRAQNPGPDPVTTNAVPAGLIDGFPAKTGLDVTLP